MLYRTLSEAQAEHTFASWIGKGIVRFVGNYYRTYQFPDYHKCKRCRKANQRGRLHSNGAVCSICGNPYGGFVRQSRRWNGTWETMRHCYDSSGLLH